MMVTLESGGSAVMSAFYAIRFMSRYISIAPMDM